MRKDLSGHWLIENNSKTYTREKKQSGMVRITLLLPTEQIVSIKKRTSKNKDKNIKYKLPFD